MLNWQKDFKLKVENETTKEHNGGEPLEIDHTECKAKNLYSFSMDQVSKDMTEFMNLVELVHQQQQSIREGLKEMRNERHRQFEDFKAAKIKEFDKIGKDYMAAAEDRFHDISEEMTNSYDATTAECKSLR